MTYGSAVMLIEYMERNRVDVDRTESALLDAWSNLNVTLLDLRCTLTQLQLNTRLDAIPL